MTQLEFTKGMTLISMTYAKFDMDAPTMEIWYSFFEEIRGDVFILAVKSFIRQSRFAPTVADLLSLCEDQRGHIINETLKLMWERGYFTQKGALTETQGMRNFEKASYWVQRKLIPEWFEADMRLYEQYFLENKQQLKLAGSKSI